MPGGVCHSQQGYQHVETDAKPAARQFSIGRASSKMAAIDAAREGLQGARAPLNGFRHSRVDWRIINTKCVIFQGTC